MQPASYGDVTVRPIAQKPTLFPDHDVAPRRDRRSRRRRRPSSRRRPSAPPVRAPRMPKFEELPMPAQNEIRQARGEAEEEHPQKTRLSLLQRLANVGLGRRDEETEPPIAARASGPAMAPMPPLPERKPQRSRRPADRGQRAGIGICPAARRRRDWMSMAARRLLQRRHRATIIWISRPSCAARPTEACYNSDDEKGPGWHRRGLCFCQRYACVADRQATDIK